MLSRIPDLIQLFSVYATLIPIFVCILILKKDSRDIWLFSLFFIIGFFTDVSMYNLKKAGITEYQEIFSALYSLVEATFFYWLIWINVDLKFKNAIRIWYFISVFYWIGLTFVKMGIGPEGFSVSQFFILAYEVPVAFISGFILLQMVEREDTVSDKPMFWIFLGIFFYCFSTFFIAIFLSTELSIKLWFLHNIFNIITLGFYTVGLWKYYKIQKMGSKIKGA
jgi:hypothetical protein